MLVVKAFEEVLTYDLDNDRWIGGDDTITAFMNKIITLTFYQRHIFFRTGDRKARIGLQETSVRG